MNSTSVIGGKFIDGHFWVVRNGEIIDPDLGNYIIGNYTKKYYKEAPRHTCMLAVEICFRYFENITGFKRNDEKF